MAMILITHDLGVVAETCDHVAIMYAGEIMEKGTVKEVYTNAKHPYTRGLFESIPKLDEDSEKLIPIPGSAPNSADLPTGCPFHPRCKYKQDICAELAPTVKGKEHQYKCHFSLFENGEGN
jgi:peptide/nickel transport system ATP-binding protein